MPFYGGQVSQIIFKKKLWSLVVVGKSKIPGLWPLQCLLLFSNSFLFQLHKNIICFRKVLISYGNNQVSALCFDGILELILCILYRPLFIVAHFWFHDHKHCLIKVCKIRNHSLTWHELLMWMDKFNSPLIQLDANDKVWGKLGERHRIHRMIQCYTIKKHHCRFINARF